MDLSLSQALARVNNPEAKWPVAKGEFSFFDELKEQLVSLGFSTNAQGAYQLQDTVIYRHPHDYLSIENPHYPQFKFEDHAPRKIFQACPQELATPCRELQLTVVGQPLERGNQYRQNEYKHFKSNGDSRLAAIFKTECMTIDQEFYYTLGSIRRWKNHQSETDPQLVIYGYAGKKFFQHGAFIHEEYDNGPLARNWNERDVSTMFLTRWLYAHLNDEMREKLIPAAEAKGLQHITRPYEL